MKKILNILFLAFMIVALFQCRKEPAFVGTPDPTPVVITPTPDPITANLQGNILDENDQPAQGVSITVGSKNAVTDSKGFFRINDAGLDKKNTMVIAQKAGYFKGIRLFAATSGANYIKIKLIKKEQAGSVNASSGGVVSLSNGGSVNLPANGIVIGSTGANYTGVVNVYMQYIDPSSTSIAENIPGSFAAIDKDGNNVTLTSYGMMVVELESASGEKLQIKAGATATLTTPIPATAQTSAPASIALWYVDEQIGLWREEGTATKTGNNYTGEVKHFSFWNCDVPMDAVMLSMTIGRSGNLPLVNTPVKITRLSGGAIPVAVGYTDSLGQVSGLVPANQALLLEVLDPCGNTLYTQNIAPLTQNTDLGVISIPASVLSIVTVKGKLVDCNNQPLVNGHAFINFEGNTRYAITDANGNYQTTFTYCNTSVSTAYIFAQNSDGSQESAAVMVNLTFPTANLSDVVVCGDPLLTYINFNVDGADYYWDETNATEIGGLEGNATVFIYANNVPGTRTFDLYLSGGAQGVGTYPAEIPFVTEAFPVNGGFVEYLPGFTGTLTRYASVVGDYFEGSFSGQYTYDLPTFALHTINGTFRVKRLP